MNRRDLLKLLLAAPIAATLDVEKLLWVPKPIIVVPAMSAIHIPVGTLMYYGANGALRWFSTVKEALGNMPAGVWDGNCIVTYGMLETGVLVQLGADGGWENGDLRFFDKKSIYKTGDVLAGATHALRASSPVPRTSTGPHGLD